MNTNIEKNVKILEILKIDKLLLIQLKKYQKI